MNIKAKLIVAAVLIGMGWLSGWWVYRSSWQGGDFLIMEVTTESVTLVNISPARGMINSLEIAGQVDLWIPNGMGWYPAAKLKLILAEAKNQPNLGQMTAFFNFGFWPDRVETAGDWQTNRWLWDNLGPVGWLRFRLTADNWLRKRELVTQPLVAEKDNLEEIMPRDMADNQVLENNIRVTVVNASEKNGFGNMVADRLGWWGVMVTAVDTAEGVDECQISTGSQTESEKTVAYKLAEILSCKLTTGQDRNMEIILGRGIERMIKYSETYVRTF